MTPEARVVQTIDPNPCDATGCAMQTEPLTVCVDHRCPHRWTREAREDRARRDARDAERRSEPAATTCDLADCVGLANAIEECARTRCPFVEERRKSL